MGDLILQTEPVEFQHSKQTTKMGFLHQEIRQLQDQVKDLQEIVKFNKEVIKIALNPTSSRGISAKGKTNINSNETAITFNEGSSTPDTKCNPALLETVQEENAYLLDIITKLIDERNLAQSKVFAC